MKVYVIQKGVYSSKFIVGVVESKEEADQICEAISDDHYGGKAFYEEFNTEDFKTNLIKFKVNNSYGEWDAEYCEPYEWDQYDHNVIAYDDYYIVYAHNKEEAIKIAQDMKAEELAKKKGVKL